MPDFGVGYRQQNNDQYFYYHNPNGFPGNTGEGGFPLVGSPDAPERSSWNQHNPLMNINFNVAPYQSPGQDDWQQNDNSWGGPQPDGWNQDDNNWGGPQPGGWNQDDNNWGGPQPGGWSPCPSQGNDWPPPPPSHGQCDPGFPVDDGSSPPAPPQPGLLGGINPLILVLLLAGRDKKPADPPPAPPKAPTIDRAELLNRITEKFDILKVAGPDSKDAVFGKEDIDAILQSPDQYSSDIVQLAKDVDQNRDLIDLADWTSNTSGGMTHDGTNSKAQYDSTKTVLYDSESIKTALNYLKDNMSRIAARTGNTTALERADIESEISVLNTGTPAQKAIATTLAKAYYPGSDGAAKGDLIGITANASGNNNPSIQVITAQGIDNLLAILNK